MAIQEGLITFLTSFLISQVVRCNDVRTFDWVLTFWRRDRPRDLPKHLEGPGRLPRRTLRRRLRGRQGLYQEASGAQS